MKKITTIVLIIIMLFAVTATFVGCGEQDYSDLQNQLDDLNNKFNDLSNQYKDLDARIKKLETTISLLETIGDSEEFTELKNQVADLQKDLLNNSANDVQIKSQVTQMQLALDKITSNGNANNAMLAEIQTKLNTLYGEVNRVLPFENGKEYEVKLNGVVYYKIIILIEYHDGIVQSNQDIKECVSTGTHICGSIYVKNLMGNSISLETMENLMQNFFDNNEVYSILISAKKGFGFSNLKRIDPMSEGQWYFYVKPNNLEDIMIKESYSIMLKVPDSPLVILRLENVWGDENGLKPPIVGTK